MLAGVCGGIAETVGVEVMFVRQGFVIAAVAGVGVIVPVYALAWLMLPFRGEESNIFSRAIEDRRGIRLVIAVIPALVILQVVTSVLRIGYHGPDRLAHLPGRQRGHPHLAQRR